MSLLIITAINCVEIIRDSRFIAFIIAESLGGLDYYQARHTLSPASVTQSDFSLQLSSF